MAFEFLKGLRYRTADKRLGVYKGDCRYNSDIGGTEIQSRQEERAEPTYGYLYGSKEE